MENNNEFSSTSSSTSFRNHTLFHNNFNINQRRNILMMMIRQQKGCRSVFVPDKSKNVDDDTKLQKNNSSNMHNKKKKKNIESKERHVIVDASIDDVIDAFKTKLSLLNNKSNNNNTNKPNMQNIPDLVWVDNSNNTDLKSRWKSNDDFRPLYHNEQEESIHQSLVFRKKEMTLLSLMPPGRRIDYGDDEIICYPPRRKLLRRSISKRSIDSWHSTTKSSFDSTDLVFVRAASTSSSCDVSVTVVKKDKELLPIALIRKSSKSSSNFSTNNSKNESTLLDSNPHQVRVRYKTTTSSSSIHQNQHNQQQQDLYFGKASIRSLISWDSSSTNSLQSKCSMESKDYERSRCSSDIIFQRHESVGIESIISIGSTACELDCLGAVSVHTTTTITRTTSCCSSSSKISFRRTNSNHIGTAGKKNVSSKRQVTVERRPKNPIGSKLLYIRQKSTITAKTEESIFSTSTSYPPSPPTIVMMTPTIMGCYSHDNNSNNINKPIPKTNVKNILLTSSSTSFTKNQDIICCRDVPNHHYHHYDQHNNIQQFPKSSLSIQQQHIMATRDVISCCAPHHDNNIFVPSSIYPQQQEVNKTYQNFIKNLNSTTNTTNYLGCHNNDHSIAWTGYGSNTLNSTSMIPWNPINSTFSPYVPKNQIKN